MAYLATIGAFGFPDIDPSMMLKLYRELGCSACQYYRNEHDPPKTEKALGIALDAGLPFDSIHGVFGPAYDPSNPDEATRQYAVDTYRAEGELALELGAPMVVVHPAPMAADLSEFTEKGSAPRPGAMQRSMEELARIGEDLGVIYLIENVPPKFLFGSNCQQLAGMIREIDHPQLRMCFDNGHAHMVGDGLSSLEACLDVVSYLHINDNNARVDAHLIPGYGTFDWDRLGTSMGKLPRRTSAMLELFPTRFQITSEISDGLADRLTQWLVINCQFDPVVSEWR